MIEAQIKGALIALLSGITNADAATIDQEMAQLDALAEKHRPELHPQLVHFLERRSYAKALAFLGGEVPASGACSPRKPSA
jgi:hypothetical protein